MSQANAMTGPWKSRHAATLVIFAFLFGAFGFMLGRWPVGTNETLVQTGEISPLTVGSEVDCRYALPYASVPCLTVEEPIISYEMIQHTPQGFRIRIKNFYANFDTASYTAKGVPANR